TMSQDVGHTDRDYLTPPDGVGGQKSTRCTKSRCALGSGIGFGFALICLSITVAVAFPVVFRNLIATMLPIANGSVTYSTWESPSDSTPIYMQFWLFNLTNGVEFLNGAKPAVEQIGPFTYEEQRNKGNITAYSNSTIAYKEYRSFHFRPDLSCCPEETELSIANLAYFTLTNMLRYSSSVLQLLADDLFKSTHNPPVMHRSVKEILWGYDDPTLKFGADIAKIVGYKINPTIGLFYGKNGSDDGEYLIFTGQSDVGHLALVDRWQFNTSLSNWDSKSSNMLNGTDGTMFPPFVDPKKRLYIYSTDICRSIYVTYAGPTSVRGIDLLRFTAPAEVFYNSTLNPENQGFCVGGICLDSGVLNLTTCQPGVPALASQPHFYQAAQHYIDSVIGLQPSPDCATVLDVEPNTGLVMRAAKKLQINLALVTGPGFHMSKSMKPVFMPIMWVNESATIGSDSADQFRGSVLLAVKAAAAVQWGSLAVGLVCFLACLSACACQRARRNRQNFNSDTRPDINDVSVQGLNI
ncbi:hypothetical protein BOX15_Mlig005065g1, partial [Macrostomum lignano]